MLIEHYVGIAINLPYVFRPYFALHGGPSMLTGAVPGTAVTVFDALGRLLTQALAEADGTAQLRLPAGLATGVYVVRSGSKTSASR
jgi:hypothetical protein